MSWQSELLALNPSSYWPCNGTDDLGSNNFDLTAVGSPANVPSLVYSEHAQAGQAYELTGTQYLHAGDVYDFAGDFTLLWWMRVQSGTWASAFQRILEKRQQTGDAPGWNFHGDSVDNLNFSLDIGASEAGSTFNMNLDRGYGRFIVSVWDSATLDMTVYQDGIGLGTADVWTSPIPVTAANFTIGADSGGTSRFVGVVDEVAVFDGTKLTSGQVTTLWEAALSQSLFYGRRKTIVRR